MTFAALPPPPIILLGREEVLGSSTRTAAISAAFTMEGEARLAAPGPLATPMPGSRSVKHAAADVERLLVAMRGRLGVGAWLAAYGSSPDGLATTEEVRTRVPGLGRALASAEEEEVILLLAFLAAPRMATARFLPARLRELVLADGPVPAPVRLAMPIRIPGAAGRLEALQLRGGPELPFWLADRSLGVRFSFTRTGIAFKAHHPVIQEALEARCRKDGIDLW